MCLNSVHPVYRPSSLPSLCRPPSTSSLRLWTTYSSFHSLPRLLGQLLKHFNYLSYQSLRIVWTDLANVTIWRARCTFSSNFFLHHSSTSNLANLQECKMRQRSPKFCKATHLGLQCIPVPVTGPVKSAGGSNRGDGRILR